MDHFNISLSYGLPRTKSNDLFTLSPLLTNIFSRTPGVGEHALSAEAVADADIAWYLGRGKCTTVWPFCKCKKKYIYLSFFLLNKNVLKKKRFLFNQI